MAHSNRIQRVGGILFGASLVLPACSSGGQRDASDGTLGQARVFIEEAPADVGCVRITAAGSVIAKREFDVVAGESSVFSLQALPLGLVSFSGEAFPTACSQASAAPYWVADPVAVTLEPGVTADVALTMHRNGQALVAVDFVEETAQGGVSAGGGSAGAPSGGTGGSAGAGSTPLRPLLFSEYVEGSSTYKALEITALQNASFDGCRVAVYFNGAATASGIALSGSLNAGDSYVLCSSSLASAITTCDQTAGLTFNGDDAIVLECDGATIDAIGQVGVDPGTAWGTGEVSLVDHTLRRQCSVAQADTNPADAFDPALEWSGQPIDTFDDLGQRACP